MLVHLGSGIAGGFSNVFFGLNNTTVLLLGACLMTVWEVLEYVMRVREHVSNRVIDVVVGMVGVVLALVLAPLLSRTAHLAAFFGTLVVSTIGMGFGLRARRRRTKSKG